MAIWPAITTGLYVDRDSSDKLRLWSPIKAEIRAFGVYVEAQRGGAHML